MLSGRDGHFGGTRGPGSGTGAASELDLDRAVLELAARGEVPVPPYPAVALRVSEWVRRDRYAGAELARLVGSDAALAGDVLRCANSAMYRRGAPVANLAQAITRLGAKELTRIALCSGMSAHVGRPGPLAVLRRILWIESVAGAVICHELAHQRGLRAEDAYMLGLLHDVGKLVAASCLENLLEKAPPTSPRPLRAWTELVERHHIGLGVLLAERWALPPLAREVIAAHHGPAAGCSDPHLLEVVAASDRVLRLLRTLAHVSRADLAGVPQLASVRERDAVALIVEKVPEFVAAFEAREPGRDAIPSLVASTPAVEPDGARPVACRVTVAVAGRVHDCAAMCIAPDALVAIGREPLPQDRLLKATIHCRPEALEVWVFAHCSAEAAGSFRLELRPYAMPSATRDRWNELR